MTELTPAIQGATGRRPSEPTRPEVPPGSAKAVVYGEGREAARPITSMRTVLERLIARDEQRSAAAEAEMLARAVADLNDELAGLP